MQKLSIFSTLIAAFRLGWQHRGLVLILAAICGIPTILTTALTLHLAPTTPPGNAPPPQLGTAATNGLLLCLSALVLLVVSIVLNNMATASLLGVLKVNPSKPELWPTIKWNIRVFTWPLIIVSILLCIVAFVITIPFSVLIALFGFDIVPGSKNPVVHGYFIGFITFLMAVVYLVFIKYALASPVIVLEDERAISALKISWRMTRGFFWFVLGSYLFLSIAEYCLDALFQHLEQMPGFAWVMPIRLLFDSVIQFYWILLAWCMYWRIKEAEAPPPFVPETMAEA